MSKPPVAVDASAPTDTNLRLDGPTEKTPGVHEYRIEIDWPNGTAPSWSPITVKNPQDKLSLSINLAVCLAKDPDFAFGQDQMPYQYTGNRWTCVDSWLSSITYALHTLTRTGASRAWGGDSLYREVESAWAARHSRSGRTFTAFGDCPGVPCRDGILVLKRGLFEVVAHDRKYGNLRVLDVTTEQVSEAYTSIELGTEKSSLLMQFLSSSLEESQLVTFRRWLGYHLVSNTLPNAEKLLYLWGAGANGKSQLLWLIRGLVGKDACAELRLNDLKVSANLEKLVGALAMLGSEATTQTDYEILKGLTSRDPMTCNPKYRDPFVIRPECLVTQASNKAPEFKESSDAFARRVVSIHMTKSFKSGEGRIEDIGHRIVQDEYPLLVGLAVWGALEISERGRFYVPDEIQSASDQVVVAANQIEEFGKLLEFGDFEIAVEELLTVYMRWCKSQANVRSSMSRKELLAEVDRYAKGGKHLVVHPKAPVVHYNAQKWTDEQGNIEHVRPDLVNRQRVTILRGVRVRADAFGNDPIGQEVPAQRRLV